MNEVIWLVAHFPDKPEMQERINTAIQVHKLTGAPIWVFAGMIARYNQSVEELICQSLLSEGIKRQHICISKDFGTFPLYDTVNELNAVFEVAKKQGVEKMHIISNRLQLLQIQGLCRKTAFSLHYIPTALIETGIPYVLGRIILIPFAYLGIGDHFPPLLFVRWARQQFKWFHL